jgi:hypothetical protein
VALVPPHRAFHRWPLSRVPGLPPPHLRPVENLRQRPTESIPLCPFPRPAPQGTLEPMFKGLWLPKWIFDWHD